ncbi:MAG: flavodoxin family protein [Oscillospiraceae bacterium]|jgi:multimeric flavodoxin WrbA|nr:flavodoxin family protein [Oscillospiraceae bacterium]
MKVLMLNGSPRAHGCTYTALREVADTLETAGVETEILHVAKGAVRGCIACGQCSKRDNCAIEGDGVNEAIEKMAKSDGLIVGSPVYYASPNGMLLSFLDRMFYAGDCFAYKPGAAVVSARRAGTTASLDVLYKYFLIANMPMVPSQYWCMVHGHTPDDVRKDEEGMQTMRTLGRNMAWMLECFKGKELPKAEEPRKWTHFIR